MLGNHTWKESQTISLAYRAGVTVGISAPKHRGFLSGLSTAFGLGASHKLEADALIQEIAALHVSIRHIGKYPSISTQIATLRRLLLDEGSGEAGTVFNDISKVIKMRFLLYLLFVY